MTDATDTSSETTRKFAIGMLAKHGARKWLTYTMGQSGGIATADEEMQGDRLLDIDASEQKGRTEFLFELDADYTHDGTPYAVRFADSPFTFGAKSGPDVSGLVSKLWRSPDGRQASFVFDTADLAGWPIAATMRRIGSPVVRIPFSFNLDDERLGFPGWMMPDPSYHPHRAASPAIWHGGPHPPIPSFLVIPTAA